MITRSLIKYEIWLRLNKSTTTKGFYTDDKVNSTIQEALDYIATECFLADEGWTHKFDYLSPVANQVAMPLPVDMAMLLEVRFLCGTTYEPLPYDQMWAQAQLSPSSGATQIPNRFKLVDNSLYFNPPLGVGGTNFIQIEYMAYPRRLKKDSDFLPGQFDRTMFWFCVYHSCNLLSGQLQQTIDDWPQQEQKWYQKMIALVNMRTRQTIPVRDFNG